MKIIKTILVAAAAAVSYVAGAQALPYVAVEKGAASLAKAGADLTETSSIAASAFGNVAAVPFSELKADFSAGYTMWQPAASKSNIITAAGAYNLGGKLGIAAGFSYGMNPTYEVTDGTGASVGTFSPSDMQIGAGVAYRVIDFLSVGANIGYASSSLAQGYSYGAVAADVFAMAVFSDLRLTLGVADLGSGVASASGTKFSLPSSVALGAGYGKSFAEKHDVEVLIDANYYFAGGLAAALGAEYTFNDLVSLRAGYRYGGKSPIPTFASVGAGVKFSGVKLDLAYLLAGADSPMKNTLAISLGYSF